MKIIQIAKWKLELVGLIFLKNCGEKFSASMYTIFNHDLRYVYCNGIDQYLKYHDRVALKNVSITNI